MHPLGDALITPLRLQHYNIKKSLMCFHGKDSLPYLKVMITYLGSRLPAEICNTARKWLHSLQWKPSARSFVGSRPSRDTHTHTQHLQLDRSLITHTDLGTVGGCGGIFDQWLELSLLINLQIILLVNDVSVRVWLLQERQEEEFILIYHNSGQFDMDTIWPFETQTDVTLRGNDVTFSLVVIW